MSKKTGPERTSSKARQRNSCIVVCARDGASYAKKIVQYLARQGVEVATNADDVELVEWFQRVSLDAIPTTVLVFVASPRALRHTTLCMVAARWMSLGGRIASVCFFDPIANKEFASTFEDNLRLLDYTNCLDGSAEMDPAILEGVADFVLAQSPGSRAEKQRHSFEKRPLNEGKLILVGRGEVGKTSLVNRLVDGEFDETESKTEGIQIRSWLLPHQGTSLKLNVWDFGGQEIMHATHQFFLTERSIYLLVINGRKGGEDLDAEYWLKHIESFGKESPVIVVLNKAAQQPCDLNYRGLRARYPQIRGFVKTDCKTEEGIGKLRELIEEVVQGVPEVQIEVAGRWFTVKEKLEALDAEYLSYDAYQSLCAEEGVVEESERELLTTILHCLGIALNYGGDPRLQETSVLRPQWVTEGLYKVLNSRKLADCQGELSLADLRAVLPTERYPVSKHLFLLELMRKFSLCFPFHDQQDRYLVPELLGKEEPEVVESFLPTKCLNFEYHYGLLPEGLLPRFIVRTHSLSRGQAKWRSGVVLSHEGCEALVKAESADRRVTVRVRGADANARQRLLGIIRYDLDQIHRHFSDTLEVKEKVPMPDHPEFSVDYVKLVAFEQHGLKEFPELIGNRVVQVQVREMLNGVDFTEQRGNVIDALRRAKSVFFSYSHEDEELRDQLDAHLKLLQRQRVISTWHDRKILPAEEWDQKIDRRLETADIILLLVSADFIASDYCWDKEVTRAMERHEAKEAVVIPVLLRRCDLKDAPFAKLQGLPSDVKAVKDWEDRDAAWTDVAKGIRKIVEQMSAEAESRKN